MGGQPVVLHLWTTADFLQFTRPLVLDLSQAGYEVHVASSPGEELSELASLGSVRTHEVPMSRGVSPLADARSLPQLRALLRQVQPDLVHAHTPKAGLLGMLAAAAARIPHRVYQMHGLRYQTATGAGRQLLLNADRTAALLAAHVVCVSPSVRETALIDGVVADHKTRVLAAGSAAGIEPAEFVCRDHERRGAELRRSLGISPQAPCLVYAGRLARDKGLLDLATAWDQISRVHGGAQLLLAGEDDPTDPVDLAPLKARADVHFLGKLKDTRPLLALAQVVTLPSYREGLPQGLLEAALMERPVVATRVTGSIDAVQAGTSALLIAPRAPRQLAEAVSLLFSDQDLSAQLGRAGREFVAKKFRRPDVLAAYRALYTEIFRSGTG
jgi:glycosyltransferase involved in cell wall biosynthesis